MNIQYLRFTESGKKGICTYFGDSHLFLPFRVRGCSHESQKGIFRMSVVVQDGLFRLLGKTQNYAWGGNNYISQLIGFPPEAGKTYAEYWMGAHEDAPSLIVQANGTTATLGDVIKEQPEKLLGKSTYQKFGRLPYLFKILDVREMLSIQVHPTKAQAEIGFAKENELGIPLNSPSRNYKDDNHKPELEVALSDFWLLHGFQSKDLLQATLNEIPEFRSLIPVFMNEGYLGLYKHVMEMPLQESNAILAPVIDRVSQQYKRGELDMSSHDYWAAKAVEGSRSTDYDKGIFSIYFFNVVHLNPGQAVYQDAGVPHALLYGQALEIMSNSNNVVRGGLTPKYIDIPELIKLITFDSITPEIIELKQGPQPYEMIYETPSHEFVLSKMQLNRDNLYTNTAYSVDMLLMLDGVGIVETAHKEIPIKRGESAVIFSGENYHIKSISSPALIYRASIPIT
jgi:mannose-6-phosphate isomerase